MIIVMGHVQLDPSDVTEFQAYIQVLGPKTRDENGCLFYAVTLDNASAGQMLVAERWQDQASLTAILKGHKRAPFKSGWVRSELTFYAMTPRTNVPL